MYRVVSHRFDRPASAFDAALADAAAHVADGTDLVAVRIGTCTLAVVDETGTRLTDAEELRCRLAFFRESAARDPRTDWAERTGAWADALAAHLAAHAAT